MKIKLLSESAKTNKILLLDHGIYGCAKKDIIIDKFNIDDNIEDIRANENFEVFLENKKIKSALDKANVYLLLGYESNSVVALSVEPTLIGEIDDARDLNDKIIVIDTKKFERIIISLDR